MTIAFPQEETSTATPSTDNEPRTTDTPFKRPPSQKRLNANRANAQKSTGPRTPKGKQTASQNAITHNLTSSTPNPALFADPNFSTRLYELKKEHRPSTPSQDYLVEQLALIGHKLEQIPLLESRLLAAAHAGADAPPLAPNISFVPHATIADLLAIEFLKDKPTPLTRLWDLQRRLLARFQSIVRHLHQLQKHHAAQQRDDYGIESQEEQTRRLKRDKSALDEEVDRMRERNRQRDQLAREQRQRENELAAQTPTPKPPIPQPPQQSLAASRIQTPPLAQIPPNPAKMCQTTPSIAPAQNEPTTAPSSSAFSTPPRSSPEAKP
jgi:hypothetical protein